MDHVPTRTRGRASDPQCHDQSTLWLNICLKHQSRRAWKGLEDVPAVCSQAEPTLVLFNPQRVGVLLVYSQVPAIAPVPARDLATWLSPTPTARPLPVARHGATATHGAGEPTTCTAHEHREHGGAWNVGAFKHVGFAMQTIQLQV